MSRLRPLNLVAAAGLFLLAACSDQPAAPTGPSLATTPVACDYNGTKQAIVKYFAGGSDQTTAQNLLKAMQAATTDADRNNRGFDLLSWVATVTDAGRQTGTAAQGSAVANGVLACMTLSALPPGVTLPVDFAPALSVGGAFEVRGGTASATLDPLTAPVVSRSLTPPWGVEPQSGSNWPTALGGSRVLIYGWPLAVFQSNEGANDVAGQGYHWYKLPDVTLAEPLRVGYCITGPDQLLIQHFQANDGVLLQRTSLSFCGTSLSAAPIVGWGPLAIARRIGRIVGPAPLYAFALTGPGGLAGGFSDFGAVNGQHVNLTFATQPSDASTTNPIQPPIRVRALADGGTPYAGVAVTVSIAGNNGSYTISGHTTRVTGDDGIAAFDDIVIDKPGGYILEADANPSGFDPAQVLSEMFHITQ